MPKLYWMDEHVVALKRLADLASSYNKAGVLNSRKDWEVGLNKLSTQDPKNYKVVLKILKHAGKQIKPITLETKRYLTASWHAHEMRAYGLCKTRECTNKVLPNSSLCEECMKTRTKVYRYGKSYYSRYKIESNKEIVDERIDSLSEKEIKQIVKEDIAVFPIKTKKKILGVHLLEE